MDHFLTGTNSSAAAGFTDARFYHPRSATARPCVAISACLAGEPVRYDGASRELPAFAWLAQRVRLVSICPEVGAGLAVPRPPVQLVVDGATTRALGRDDPTLDVTAALAAFAQTSSTQLQASEPLCGYLFKSRSPSCGLGSTPLFDTKGTQLGLASGIQASHFQSRLPWLSFCEDTALDEPAAALAFELRCRVVFDWLYAGDTDAATLRRHYHALLRQLAPTAPADKTGCLAALQRGCAALPPARLLELFAEQVS